MWRTPAALAAILLLDEPTTVLDLRHQDLVMRLAAAGGAVLVVLHDLNLAAAHADRIADGRLTACGPPADVLSPNLLSHVYQRDIEVIDHPRTGHPLILPLRRPR